MPDGPDRWLDGDYSEDYLGYGHQNKVAFAEWVDEYESDNGDENLWAPISAVEHLWAVWADRAPHEKFVFVDEGAPNAFPVTRLRSRYLEVERHA